MIEQICYGQLGPPLYLKTQMKVPFHKKIMFYTVYETGSAHCVIKQH